MATSMNRRAWLKSSALLAGGLTVLPTGLRALAKAPEAPTLAPQPTEEATLLAEVPQLKARLLANENPFGPSEKAKQAMLDAVATSYQYPMAYARELAQKIAAYEGVTPEHILLDAGSSPLLLAAAMHYGKQGGAIITGDPSYDDLPNKARHFNTPIIPVPLTADYKLDLDAMEKKVDGKTALLYICNPNNPTGTVLETAKLKAFCERVSKKAPVFVDEAYIDYLPDPQGTTLIDAVKKGQNVIVARTFSKLHGFAGLRVGYIVAQPETIKTLSNYVVGGMSISAPAIRAALVSYQDQVFLQDALKKTLASKQFLYETLRKEGYEHIPSFTNFVMFPLRMDSKRFVDEMMKRGVGVRHWQFASKEWCRVSIGRLDEMQAFADAFKQIS
ncbi:aminotransferase class I/II-fold pyridoxal phosphate-dependent enzyme [Hymenobacter sp. HMF4947]|uniref:Aminotransferase class I/II-fold pyridoxal phosphate-dependent enzyme n=1 Tax=Hymenobacter ginkgonis TaxID=2682976 RepID=A0A7K1TG96_9BACT|nr:histidinol-phosphate transaminase [Hymenobacter ginkgonis]MVN77399.1 aminotransferase class I/II-fold pyridoxal phosphate-dependent enzyme [Hymenobacter ginkgonis]